MPVFVLNTNLPAGKIPKSFLADTSSLVAKELGKPEEVGKTLDCFSPLSLTCI